MVLALEPNMNYRWIRRDFYLESGITFPEGLLFEDAPAHFQMLLGAKIVALTSTVYYLYRVNRPGKITEEKGLRRFDVIPVLRIATKVLLRENPDPLAAAFGLRVLFRLCWGCGTMVPRSQRHAFFREAVTPFRDLPEAWLQRYFGGKIMDRAHRVLGFLIYSRMVLALFVLSLGRELRIYLLSFKDGAEL